MINLSAGLSSAALDAIADLERRVVAADGGRLNLVLQRPAVFAVFLTEHSPLSVMTR